MEEDPGLLLVKVGNSGHKLLELSLVSLVLLVRGLRLVVSHLDRPLEALRVGVNTLEEMLGDELFIVVLCDLFLIIEDDVLIGVPWLAIELLEQGPLLLAVSRLRESLSLGEQERKSQKLLLIRGVELLLVIHLLDKLLVLIQSVMEILNQKIRSSRWKRLFRVIDPIDKLLELNRISLSGDNLILITEGKILETVYLTKGEEKVISIFASSFDLELLGIVGIDGKSISHPVQELGLGDGSRLILIEVFLKTGLGVGRSGGVFEESELANKVVIALISVSAHTIRSLGMSVVFHLQFGEESGDELGGNVVSTSENGELHGILHPSLSEERVHKSSLFLKGSKPMSGDKTHTGAESGLGAQELLVLKHFSGISSSITMFDLEALDLLLLESHRPRGNVIELPLVFQLGVHL